MLKPWCMKINRGLILVLALLGACMTGASLPAWAGDDGCRIDWAHLELTPEQSQQIHSLEAQWNQEYMQMQPSVIDEQKRLTRLLSDPRSDPLEVMTLQQSIARKKEHLRASATASYLRKRQVLNDGQRQVLEDMIRQAVAQRQRVLSPGAQTEVMPDRVQNLMQRVRNIWQH